jgi:hypothetical protein
MNIVSLLVAFRQTTVSNRTAGSSKTLCRTVGKQTENIFDNKNVHVSYLSLNTFNIKIKTIKI